MPPSEETVLRFLTDFNTQQEGPEGETVSSLTFNTLSEYTSLVKNFDFTKVDTTAAKGVLDALGHAASSRAFETAGQVLDKGLEVASGAFGATGQWYGLAAGVITEQFVDWAEKKFESAMGWDEVEGLKRGDWVAINRGWASRRRVFGADDFDVQTKEEMRAEDDIQEMKKVEKLGRNIQIGLTQGAPSDGYVKVFNTQTGQAYYGPERLEGISGVYASPVGANDRVYIVDRDGTTLVVKRGSTFEILATNSLDDGFDASPAIVDNEIYLRGRKYMYCIATD